MARPKKQTVDYFPHNCTHKATIFILEQRYRNDGYALWFKLLESLGSAEGHFLDFKDVHTAEFFCAKANLTNEKCIEIINLLAKINAIDIELWNENMIIWSDNFIEGIRDAYRNRTQEIPIKPSFLRKILQPTHQSDVNNPQTKEENTKVKDNKIEFEKFWTSYDKKVGDKNKCKKLWNTLKIETQQEILDYIPKWKPTITDKQFQPHPYTFLHQERWTNEIIQPLNNKPKPVNNGFA